MKLYESHQSKLQNKVKKIPYCINFFLHVTFDMFNFTGSWSPHRDVNGISGGFKFCHIMYCSLAYNM